MAVAYIGLGSNLGNRRENLLQAWRRLGENDAVSLLALSEPYRTEPVGMESTNWFMNAVGSIRTTLEPEELLQQLIAGAKHERCLIPASAGKESGRQRRRTGRLTWTCSTGATG